jgi:mono/diheme cytochrome c family protein
MEKPRPGVEDVSVKTWTLTAATLLAACAAAPAAEPTPAERGKADLLGKTYIPPSVTLSAYEGLWKEWGLKEKPTAADFDRMVRERYGLHAAPYPNDGLPMGLRKADLPFGLGKGQGVAQDCLICHGGSIAGKSYVGLGNASLDYQAFYEETAAADGRPRKPPFHFTNVRGTTEAGGFAVFLLGFREPDLSLRTSQLDLDLHDDLCEDPPAWWLLKKKKTMYHTGGGDQRSVRSLMQFMMTPLNFRSDFEKAEPDFKDIREYILSLEPPKYPLPVDADLADQGELLFRANCSRCHGTYGEHWTYPNKIIPIDKIGTDRRRYDGLTAKLGEYYNKTWFAADYPALESAGYQAPPLDGVWATAPYFHNGSAPTVYDVLNSKARPKVFTRSYGTDLDAYDPVKLGWKVRVLDGPPDPEKTSALEARKVYDTTQPGRGNGGHTYGDGLSDAERKAIIEYLKTL